MDNFTKLMICGAKDFNIVLSSEQCETFYNYYKMVVEYNKNVNLTAITDETDFIIKHFLDSISAENLIPQGATVCDIGAGAGFPSLPLKIVRNDLNFVLFEALNKRVVFLEKAISELKLNNVKAFHIRAEDAGKDKYRNNFDVVVARAVADTNTLIEYAIPLLKAGGIFIAYKGSKQDDFINLKSSVKKINAVIQDIKTFNLPFSNDLRTLIVIKKTGNTPLEYPRTQAKIKKFPL